MSSEPQHQFDRHLPAFRIIDANANRAGEGFRVLEEFCRFALADSHLTRLCKELRHELQQILASVGCKPLLTARDTLSDVGTQVSAADEYQRQDVREIAAASQKRVEQALRCLEEYLKPSSPELAPQVEQLRYRAYTVGRAIWQAESSQKSLCDAQLYVLLDGTPSAGDCVSACKELLEAGVRMIQLRDKQLDDRSLVALARSLRRVTREFEARLIINDRPDIAQISHADGVHVGQDEIEVRDARSLLGVDKLIGVSTHSIQQARTAVLEGADYIGCGPTYRTTTKEFADFPGLEFLRQVANEIQLPAYAIGGIGPANLTEIVSTGFTRVAVSSAIVQAESPAAVAQSMQQELRAK
jgi:thiamine-phosphate pyrophosphorylase